jgi:ferric-dicitrate binding protein FerR (iron transport regulator)
MISESEAYTLIAKQLAGELSANEAERLDEWIQSSPANKKKSAALTNLWNTAEAHFPDIDTERAWKKVDRKTRPVIMQLWYSPALRIAALLLLTSLLGMISYRYLAVGVSSVQTAGRETKRIELPDGTIVWLKEYSSVSWSGKLTEKRSLSFEGIGFFQVKRDEAHPFIIQTPHGSVQVLGTSFEVRAIRKDTFERVTVATGKVHFSSNNGGALTLVFNQEGLIGQSGFQQIDSLDASSLTSWKDKTLEFDNEPLGKVAMKMERYFNIKIRFSNPHMLNCHFTAHFENPTQEQVTSAICRALQLHSSYSGRTITFSGKGCQTR